MNMEKKLKNEFEESLEKAIEYLKSIGCTEIILFGSLSNETFNEFSDIDLAISGISPRPYFKALAVLPSIIGKRLDLILLDHVSDDFKKKIRKEGQIIYAI